MKMLRIAGIVLILTALLIVGCSKPATPEGQFPTKQITWLIPASPGGGYGTIARTVGQALPDLLPNKVDIYIVNLPGLAGRKTASTLAKADPDGYTISWVTAGMGPAQVLNPGDFDFDVDDLTPICSPFGLRYAIWVQADSDIHSMDDLLALNNQWRTILFKPGEAAYAVSKFWIDAFQVAPTEVPPGEEEEDVLMLRGDVEATVGSIGRLSKFIESGDLRPILVVGEARDSAIPDIPSFKDLGKEVPMALQQLRYMVYAPPGLPKDIATVLEESFRKAAETDTLKDFATKTNRWLDYQGSDFVADYQASLIEMAGKYPHYYK
jgi:tripartite-type tricarboxylate transporter receptor subunit TctC